MKCPPFFRVAILALLGLRLPCAAQEDAQQAAKMVSVQVEYIEVSHEQLLDLLFTGDPPAADSTPLRKKLQGMIQAGQATLLETTLVSTRSGVKASVDSQREWIYPTEFEPFQVPREIDPPGQPQRLTLEDRRGLEAMVAPMTPTSFETRHLGASLEVAPTAGEHDVSLELSASLAWGTGRIAHVERKDSAGNITKGEMPAIYSMSLRSALTCPAGRPVFAGALSPMDAEGNTDPSRKVMVFVKCRVAGASPASGSADVLASLQVTEMPQALAAELASADEDGDALFRKSRELVQAGQAKLFETSVLRVPSGCKGTVESVQEHISITEYNPTCQGLFGTEPPTGLTPVPPPQIRFPFVPTSFETRNVGNTLEVEPTWDESALDIRWAWDFVLHPGDSIVEDWTDSLDNHHQRKMPSYLAFKANNATTLKSGKWRLVSMQDSSDASGKIDPSRKLLVFLRADSLAAAGGK